MELYIGTECPVCHKKFTEDDDIVVCPICGTPHHRKCYKEIGHCVNANLHESGFTYKNENKPATQTVEVKNDTTPINEYYTPQNSENTQTNEKAEQHCVNCNAPIEKGAPFCNVCGAKQPESSYNNYSTKPQPNQFNPTLNIDLNGDLDGEKVEDIVATVRTNPTRYLSVFNKLSAKKKSTSWNWMAFIFGKYYLFFRKMYKQGFLFLFLDMLTTMIGVGSLTRFAPEFTKNIMDLYSSKSTFDTNAITSVMTSTADASTATYIVYATFGVMLLLRIILGLFSDKFYKTTVYDIIKDVKSKMENGATFAQSPLLLQQNQQFTQNDMKNMFLSKKGGISFFLPIMAYLINDIVISAFYQFIF